MASERAMSVPRDGVDKKDLYVRIDFNHISLTIDMNFFRVSRSHMVGRALLFTAADSCPVAISSHDLIKFECR